MSNKTTKKASPKESKKTTNSNNKGKTSLILKMVNQGKNRKQILDKLVEMDSTVSRKSNAGLVSHVFKTHNLLGKVPSGIQRKEKKEIKVKTKKKAKKTKKVA